MDKLTTDFGKSLFNDSKDIIEDYMEISIDSFIEEGVLKEIPIVKSIVSVLKVGKNIHDRNLLEQTLTFINEFNNNSISKEKIKEYKDKIENNDRRCKEELQRVMLILNNNIDKEKSIILARLFKAYINENINWKEFCEYSDITNRLFLEDIRILEHIKNNKKLKGYEGDSFRVERIYSLGIIGNTMSTTVYEEIKENVIAGRVLNSIGKKYCNIIF